MGTILPLIASAAIGHLGGFLPLERTRPPYYFRTSQRLASCPHFCPEDRGADHPNGCETEFFSNAGLRRTAMHLCLASWAMARWCSSRSDDLRVAVGLRPTELQPAELGCVAVATPESSWSGKLPRHCTAGSVPRFRKRRRTTCSRWGQTDRSPGPWSSTACWRRSGPPHDAPPSVLTKTPELWVKLPAGSRRPE